MNEDLAREWGLIVGAWEASGLSVAAYCREHSLSVWRLHYWRKRLRPPSDDSGGFVSMSFAGGPSSGLRIDLGDGLSLEIDRGFDSSELSRVLSVVRGQC